MNADLDAALPELRKLADEPGAEHGTLRLLLARIAELGIAVHKLDAEAGSHLSELADAGIAPAWLTLLRLVYPDGPGVPTAEAERAAYGARYSVERLEAALERVHVGHVRGFHESPGVYDGASAEECDFPRCVAAALHDELEKR